MEENAGKKHLFRIAMIGHKRIPSREGGIEVVVEELGSRMVARGYEVTCYNRKGHHIGGKKFDTARLVEYRGMRLKYVFTVDRKGWAAMTSSVTAAFCAAFGPYDVVHFHAEGPCFMMWLPRLFGKRCIATIHGLDHQRAKWGFLAKLYIMLGEKMAVLCADEIIVLSRNIQKYFDEKYGRITRFIPNGINAPEYDGSLELIQKKYGLEKGTYFCSVSRLTEEKGIHTLIEAYEKLQTDKKLVIAGAASDSGEYERRLRKMAEGNPDIIFTGFVTGSLLDEIYGNAYAYVLPSNLEGMPLSLLEAMSYGNCVVGSDIPEISSVIKDNGITFQKGNVDDLTLKLQWILDNPEIAASYRQKSSSYVLDKYNWEETVRRTLKLYKAEDGEDNEK